MANATLADEYVVAFNAARLDTIPPASIIRGPKGRNVSAAFIIPKSP